MLGKPIPPKVRKHLEGLERMHKCEMESLKCHGAIEWQHAHETRIDQEAWQIVALCTRHHRGDLKNAERDRWLSYKYANETDLKKYPKRYKRWVQDKKYLMGKYPVDNSIEQN